MRPSNDSLVSSTLLEASEGESIHMNGRAYDYNLGRFLSVDPFIQAPGNSQSMNPYSYIMNNPLAGTDPSGYIAEVSNMGGLIDDKCVTISCQFGQLTSGFTMAGNNGGQRGGQRGGQLKREIEEGIANIMSRKEKIPTVEISESSVNEQVDDVISDEEKQKLLVIGQARDAARDKVVSSNERYSTGEVGPLYDSASAHKPIGAIIRIDENGHYYIDRQNGSGYANYLVPTGLQMGSDGGLFTFRSQDTPEPIWGKPEIIVIAMPQNKSPKVIRER